MLKNVTLEQFNKGEFVIMFRFIPFDLSIPEPKN